MSNDWFEFYHTVDESRIPLGHKTVQNKVVLNMRNVTAIYESHDPNRAYESITMIEFVGGRNLTYRIPYEDFMELYSEWIDYPITRHQQNRKVVDAERQRIKRVLTELVDEMEERDEHGSHH